MRKILLVIIASGIALALPTRAQDAALEERINKLAGYLQDLRDAQEAQRKQIEQLSKDMDALRERINKTENVASQDDLRKLAKQLQEIDDKREADKKLILNVIKDLGKTAPSATRPTPPADEQTSTGADKGYEYVIQSGDTLSAIVKAYRDQGIKVTLDQILAANPKLKPTAMQPGQKIFIPAP